MLQTMTHRLVPTLNEILAMKNDRVPFALLVSLLLLGGLVNLSQAHYGSQRLLRIELVASCADGKLLDRLKLFVAAEPSVLHFVFEEAIGALWRLPNINKLFYDVVVSVGALQVDDGATEHRELLKRLLSRRQLDLCITERSLGALRGQGPNVARILRQKFVLNSSTDDLVVGLQASLDDDGLAALASPLARHGSQLLRLNQAVAKDLLEYTTAVNFILGSADTRALLAVRHKRCLLLQISVDHEYRLRRVISARLGIERHNLLAFHVNLLALSGLCHKLPDSLLLPLLLVLSVAVIFMFTRARLIKLAMSSRLAGRRVTAERFHYDAAEALLLFYFVVLDENFFGHERFVATLLLRPVAIVAATCA